jgi:hypothetical protein
MEPIRRAIWYIEAHFASPIGLAEIAEASQLSRFELANEPLFLIEHYGPGFDPVTGQGGTAVWVPLKD